MRVPIILACLTAACSASPEPAAENNVAAAAPAPAEANAQTAEPAAQPKLAIDGEGLRLFDAKSGSARPLAFGTPREQVMAALAFRGPPEPAATTNAAPAGSTMRPGPASSPSISRTTSSSAGRWARTPAAS